MRAIVWQTLALGLIAATLVSIAGDLADFGSGAIFGYTLSNARSDELGGRVVKVVPGSPVAQAGIETGDYLQLAGASFEQRVRFIAPSRAGERLDVTVGHGATKRRVTLVSVGAPARNRSVTEVAYELLRLVFIAIGALIVVRRPDRPDARALASFFVAFAFGFLERPPWYPESVRAFLFLARPVAVFFALYEAVRFAAIFPDGGSPLRRAIARTAMWIFVADVVTFLGLGAPLILLGW